ncbi:MAG: protein kinase [Silicimonas sp.]|nr:protein kinase [Silicimonas sp.]
MHKNEVIDLRNYRDAEVEDETGEDPASQYLRAGTILLHGQYTITKYLNCGGFGITYRAIDSLGRDVVIKECFPGALCFRTGNDMCARKPAYKDELESIVGHFIKEAKRLANLQHDNIVHVHQIFEENHTAYMAMDFIDGPDILDILEEDSLELSPLDVEFLTEKLLHAIKFVHDRGILHRDISPDNILIDKQGEPVLIDFGSAREHATSSDHTISRLKFVKDGYSPQEFYIAGSDQGTWSDIYSFAASVYHMVAGHAPVDAQSRLAALATKTDDPYVPLVGRIGGYPPRFLEAIDKALEVMPENRIQTADEWIAALVSRPILSRKNVSRVTSRIIEASEEDSGRKVIAIAAAVGVAAIGLTALLVFGPSKDAGLSSPFEEMAAAGPVETTPIMVSDQEVLAANAGPEAIIAEPTLDIAVPGTGQTPDAIVAVTPEPVPDTLVEPGPIVVTEATPGALAEVLPVVAENTGIDLANGQDVPRVASIDALPVKGIALVSFPPPAVAVSLAPTPLAIGTGDDALAFKVSPGTKVTPVAGIAALAAPVIEGGPEIPRLPTKPDAVDTFEVSRFEPGSIEVATLTLPGSHHVTPTPGLNDLPTVIGEKLATVDTTAPPFFQKRGPLAATQVDFSHWDVEMPVLSVPERVRNSNTIRITEITDANILGMSGDWIKEGVVIYSFNGETLQPDTTLSTHILNALLIDPDGYARSTVRYRDPDSGTIDRGLIAVPAVRRIGLADGSIFEARMKDLNWLITVVEVGRAADGSLRAGDVLTKEMTTGVLLASHEDLAKALEQLVVRKVDTAQFAVLRNGSEVQASWSLARED